MSNCKLIVFEKTSHWAAALRLHLKSQPPRLVETRSWADCRAVLDAAPASLVAVEVTTANLEAALEWMQALLRQYPLCRIAAMAAWEEAAGDLLLREAGAIDVIRS